MKRNIKPWRIVLIAAILLVTAFVAISFLLIDHFMGEYFDRSEQKKYSEYLRWSDYEGFERETVTFPSGSETLTGYIYGKTDAPLGLVVVSHGLGGYSEGYIAETKYFVDNGFMVFAYDNTGSGASTGDSCIGLVQSALDLDSALTYIEQQPVFEGLPVCLYGHSWGGFATTAVLNFDHDIKAVASLAGYNDSMEQMIYVGKGILGPFIYAEYPFLWLTLRSTFGKDMDLTAAGGIDHAADTKVMIIQGDLDDFVGFDGPCIYANKDLIKNPNVQFVLLEGRGHSDLMMDQSSERLAYMRAVDEEYERLEKEYDGEIPEDIIRGWNAPIDKELTSKLDEQLFADILAFYKDAISD